MIRILSADQPGETRTVPHCINGAKALTASASPDSFI